MTFPTPKNPSFFTRVELGQHKHAKGQHGQHHQRKEKRNRVVELHDPDHDQPNHLQNRPKLIKRVLNKTKRVLNKTKRVLNKTKRVFNKTKMEIGENGSCYDRFFNRKNQFFGAFKSTLSPTKKTPSKPHANALSPTTKTPFKRHSSTSSPLHRTCTLRGRRRRMMCAAG